MAKRIAVAAKTSSKKAAGKTTQRKHATSTKPKAKLTKASVKTTKINQSPVHKPQKEAKLSSKAPAKVVKAVATPVKSAARPEATARSTDRKVVADKQHSVAVMPTKAAAAHKGVASAPHAAPSAAVHHPQKAVAAAPMVAHAKPAATSQPMRAVAAAVAKPLGPKISAPALTSPKVIAERVAAAQQQQASAAQKKPVNQRHGFKKDEFIVYPAHGVGRIVGIEEQEIAGMSLELFVISFEKDKMTLRVPTGKLQSVGMRKLADEDVVAKAMETLKGRARIKRTMWSRRAQEYEAKINSGDLVSIAEVVRDLFRSEQQPEQSYSERQLYEAALDRMAREIAAVDKIDERNAVQRITEVLSKSAKGRRLAAEASEGESADAEEVKAA